MNRLRVLVVEDNYMMRLGTVTLVRSQPDMELVGEAEDGAQGVTLYRHTRPDVVVADLRMPHFTGAQLAAALAREEPPAKVLIFSHFASAEDLRAALDGGALGYVTKEIRPDDFLEAVRTVGRGVRYVPPLLAARVEEAREQATITRRERDVLRLLASGLTNAQIGARLGLVERTVVMHVSNLLHKLGARSRTEAVALARRRGIIDDAE